MVRGVGRGIRSMGMLGRGGVLCVVCSNISMSM